MATLIPFGAPPICDDQSVTINGELRTTANPCGAFCTRSDLAGWKSAARVRVGEVMARSGLSAQAMDQARDIAGEIESIDAGSFLDVAAACRRLADLYRIANCLSTIPSGEELPVIPDPPKNPTQQISSTILLGMAVIAIAYFSTQRR